jgi:pimeloyl-ACP methyl ester carboxylesterase
MGQNTTVPVVLVHGTPLDRHEWDPVIAQLAGRQQTIAYDLRGHGAAADAAPPTSYGQLSDDLAALLDEQGVERAHVVGHSFGGQVVQAFAAAHPDRVAGLTVVCARTSPYPPFATAADRIEAEGAAVVGDAAMARWFTARQLADDGPGVAYAREALRRVRPQTMAAAFRLIAAFSIPAGLRRLTCPKRFLAAERDLVATASDMRAGALAVDARFSVVAGVGHMFPVEAPQLLATVLADA